MGHDQQRNHSEACRQIIETAMRESEAGQERLQRTTDRIDVRTAQAVEEIIANYTEANVFAADNEDIKIEAESIPVQPDEQLEAVHGFKHAFFWYERDSPLGCRDHCRDVPCLRHECLHQDQDQPWQWASRSRSGTASPTTPTASSATTSFSS